MFEYSDFADKETESYVVMASAYDFYDHVEQQNKRDDASRTEYHAPEQILRAISHSEKCERCEKDLEARVFIWNGMRLCKSCKEEGQNTWVLFSKGPNAVPQRISMQPLKKANKRSLMDSLISEFLSILGLERIEKEIGIMNPKVPIKRVRLLVAQRPDKKQMPIFEGMMKGIHRRILKKSCI